jgi:3-phosphoglycerate kinase
MAINIEQLAKKHLYTVEGPVFWEAQGYNAFAKEIIDLCANKVDHISISGGGTIGDLIRKQFVIKT